MLVDLGQERAEVRGPEREQSALALSQKGGRAIPLGPSRGVRGTFSMLTL